MDINEIITRSEKNEFLKFKNFYESSLIISPAITKYKYTIKNTTKNQLIMNHIEAWAIFKFSLMLIKLDISEIERIDIDRDIETMCRGKYLFMLLPALAKREFKIIKNSLTILYCSKLWIINGTLNME